MGWIFRLLTAHSYWGLLRSNFPGVYCIGLPPQCLVTKYISIQSKAWKEEWVDRLKERGSRLNHSSTLFFTSAEVLKDWSGCKSARPSKGWLYRTGNCSSVTKVRNHYQNILNPPPDQTLPSRIPQGKTWCSTGRKPMYSLNGTKDGAEKRKTMMATLLLRLFSPSVDWISILCKTPELSRQTQNTNCVTCLLFH